MILIHSNSIKKKNVYLLPTAMSRSLYLCIYYLYLNIYVRLVRSNELVYSVYRIKWEATIQTDI